MENFDYSPGLQISEISDERVSWCGVIAGDEEVHRHNTDQLQPPGGGLSIGVLPPCAMSGRPALYHARN